MAKYERKRRGHYVSVKAFAAVLAVVLLIGCAVGGTVAWLTDKTDAVKNTFTVGNIDIDLDETTTDYKIVPGVDIAKNPVITVDANSEDCWVFVKVEEANWLDALTYTLADGWTELTAGSGVYYREYGASATDTVYTVLKDNKVAVSEDLTKVQIDAITTNPTLTFTAYAIQKAGFTTAADAWAKVSG